MTSEEGLTYWQVEQGEKGEQLANLGHGDRFVAAPKRMLLQELPRDAMPARPRGDLKERTFSLLIRDGIDPTENHQEKALIGDGKEIEGSFSDADMIQPDLRRLFGEIVDDHYVIEASGGTRFLFPFQSYLPGAYKFHGREKGFSGIILAFLCQPREDGQPGFNEDLIGRFYDLFNNKESLNLLDLSVLQIAKESAGEIINHTASASLLVKKHYADLPNGPGALLAGAHLRFQKDLETVLGIKNLNRRDKINFAITTLWVHLALYFQRLSWLLEEELTLTLKAIQDQTIPLSSVESCFKVVDEVDSAFAGTIAFRVPTRQGHPITKTDPAHMSWHEQNRRVLLMPANLSVLGACRAVAGACGADASEWTFYDVLRAHREEPELAGAIEEALRWMAVETVAELGLDDQEDIKTQVEGATPGVEVFRESLLKTNRSDLRRSGRDLVHAFAKRGGRGYILTRGPHTFFEIGQDLLLLLAKLIVGEQKMPYREFLKKLRSYGFAPQSREDEDQLAETLRALNLLEKHSDAGEAMYVKHFL